MKSIPNGGLITISRDGEELGQLPEGEVEFFYKEGRLIDSDHYWTAGMAEWEALANLMRTKPPFPAHPTEVANQPPPTPTNPIHPISAKPGRKWRAEGRELAQLAAKVTGAVLGIGIGTALEGRDFVASAFVGAFPGLLLGLIPYQMAIRYKIGGDKKNLLWISAAAGALGGLLLAILIVPIEILYVLEKKKKTSS